MNTPLHIIADSNIWGAQQAFEALPGFDVQLDILEHQQITAQRVQDADILLVRSSTKVNASLLEHAQVRFVGTATIGDDHVDKDYLQQRHITFSSAAGSSTESVVEYMLAAFFHVQQLGYMNFSQDTLGIIGVGRIGGLLDQACAKLGFNTLLNDPPRQAKEHNTTDFSSLQHVLQHADILTLHTPLIQDQSATHHTAHLLNAHTLQQFQGKGIINAGRGACLDNLALLAWLAQDKKRFAVLDCWENEPNIHLPLVAHPQVVLATPHIAGHSLDGKAANTQVVYDALCHFLDIPKQWQHTKQLPDIQLETTQTHQDKQQLVQSLYAIAADNQRMKDAAFHALQGEKSNQNGHTFAQWFKHDRRHYPVRRSWKKSLNMLDAWHQGTFF